MEACWTKTKACRKSSNRRLVMTFLIRCTSQATGDERKRLVMLKLRYKVTSHWCVDMTVKQAAVIILSTTEIGKHAEKELSYSSGALTPASSRECLEKLRLINCRMKADWREVCGTAGVTSWLQTGVHGDQSRQERNMAAASLVHRQTGPKQTSCVWNRSSLTPTCSLYCGFYGARHVASSSAEWEDTFRHYLDHSRSPLILHYYRTM